MPRGEPSPKLAITVDPDVHRGIVVAAPAEDGVERVGLAHPGPARLKVRDGLAVVVEWEAEHGAFAESELAAARQRVAGGLAARA